MNGMMCATLQYCTFPAIFIIYQVRKHLVYCACGALVERPRERDGSDVTIVALKLVMSSLFPLSKIHTLRSATLIRIVTMFAALKFVMI